MNLSAEQLVASPKEHQILHFGYLTKQGSVVASWRRRFFILYAHQLVYYKNIKDKQVQGTLEIGKQHCIRVSRADEECKKKYALQIEFSSRKPFFAFGDVEADIDTWLIKITEAIGNIFIVKPLHYFLNKQEKSDFEFESIKEALDKAQGGETIQIYPGLYLEDFLTITKPVQLLGITQTDMIPFEYKHEPHIQELLNNYSLNPHTQVIILSHRGNSCFVIKSNSISMKQLHIVNCSMNNHTFNSQCIEMDNGQAVLEECECINTNQGSGLLIMNTSQLQLCKVQIHHCKDCGIVCMDRSITHISQSQIHHNQLNGVYCCGESQCHLHGNELHENGMHGVAVTDKSQVFLNRNHIHHNEASGIRVSLESTTCVQENQICYNKECAVSRMESESVVQMDETNQLSMNGYE